MLCAVCKGKGLCGLARCPITARFHSLSGSKPVTGYTGTAPSIFIGSSGYPSVHGGPLLVNDSDLPTDWLARGLGIEDIVRLRAETIRGVSSIAPYIGPIQEIALAPRPVTVEASFDRPVRFNPDFDRVTAPVGCSGSITRLDVLDHPGTDRAVDKAVSDTDLPAGEACGILHRSGIDVYRILPFLPPGCLGESGGWYRPGGRLRQWTTQSRPHRNGSHQCITVFQSPGNRKCQQAECRDWIFLNKA